MGQEVAGTLADGTSGCHHPLPAPWLGFGGDFSFSGSSPRETAAFFEGRLSLPSGFLFVTLAMALGVDEVSPLTSLAVLSFF